MFDKILNYLVKNIKKTILYIIIIFIAIPLFIQTLFWIGKTSFSIPTNFSADAILSYCGSILALIATLLLGFIAWQQNKKSNDINERLLNLESTNSIPFLCIGKNFNVSSYTSKLINLHFTLKNSTNKVIEILSISNLKIVKTEFEINYTTDWLSGNMIISNHEVEVNFKLDLSNDDVNFPVEFFNPKPKTSYSLAQHKCELTLGLSYLGSNEHITQKAFFYIYVEVDEFGKISSEGHINTLENIITRDKSK